MDLALALVEDDLGRDIAHAVAKETGHVPAAAGQSVAVQRAAVVSAAADRPDQAAVSAIHADPGAEHGITELAGHAGLSPRHLQRRFTAETGMPPSAYVERVRSRGGPARA